MWKKSILLFAVFASIGRTVQLELEVGSACQLHNGETGVCENSRSCDWVRNKLQSNEMTLRDIRRCLFVDGDNDIICCGDEHPNKTSNSGGHGKPRPCSADVIVFDESDCMTAESTTKAVSTNLVSKFDGSKIAEACTRYSELATFLTDNIINGVEVGPGELPHMVALGYASAQGGHEFRCGATLIADNWVLSAAHCIKSDAQPIIVRMGVVALESDEEDPIDRNVVRVVRHPAFSLRFKKNDIALIQFDGSVEFNDYVRPACIRTDTADPPVAQELTIAGWGTVTPGTTDLPGLLMKANVSAVALPDCNRTFTERNKLSDHLSLRALSVSQMCAVNPRDNSDACQGDSGGPLFMTDNSSVSTVIGIISAGISCGSQLPGLYTRVAAYTAWIESVVWP